MERINIEFPDKVLTTIPLQVRITDINYGNHAGNDAIVGFLHEARVAWLQQLGWTELDAAGTGLIMGSLAINFKKEMFYGNLLHIAISAGNIGRAGFTLFYRITDPTLETVYAVAQTGMVCFDYANRKPVAIPPDVLLVLTQ